MVIFLQHEHERNIWGKMYEDVMVVDMNNWKEKELVKVPMKVHNYVNQSFHE